MSNDRKFSKPEGILSFYIYRPGSGDYAWGIILNRKDASKECLHTFAGVGLISVIKYGELPDCFETRYPESEIVYGKKYVISQSCSPHDKRCRERVYFMIDKCEQNEKRICLKTNSLAPDEISKLYSTGMIGIAPPK